MKASFWSLLVLATLVVVLVDGEGEGGGDCATKEVKPTANEAFSCLSASVEQTFPTPEEARLLINRRCLNWEPSRQCLRDLIEAPPSCGNLEEVMRYFRLLQQLLEDTLEVACRSQNQERLARIYQEFLETSLNKERARALESALRECAWAAGFTRTGEDVPLGRRLPDAYDNLKIFRECFAGYDGEFGNVTGDVDAIVGDLLGSIKCPDPAREGFVSCKVLVEGGGDGDCSSFDEVTVRERLRVVTDCLTPNIAFRDTLTSTRSQVFEYCARRGAIRQCMSEVAALGANCLDNNQTRRFDLLRTNMEVVLEVVCADGGGKFARFIFETKNLPLGKDINTLGRECTQVSNLHDQKTFELDMHTYASYAQFKNLRDCYLNKGRTVLPAINDFSDLTSAILARVKCLHPQDYSTVPCETLEEGGSGNSRNSTYQSAPGQENSSNGSQSARGQENSSNDSQSPQGQENSSNDSQSAPGQENSSNDSQSARGQENSSNGSQSLHGQENSSNGSQSARGQENSSNGSQSAQGHSPHQIFFLMIISKSSLFISNF